MVALLTGQPQQHQLLGQHVQNQEIKEGSWGRLKAGGIGGGIDCCTGHPPEDLILVGVNWRLAQSPRVSAGDLRRLELA